MFIVYACTADLPEAEKSLLMEMMRDLEHRSAVYALSSADGNWIYKGSTRNLAERMAAHCEGKVSRTRNRRPLKLVYWEYIDDYTEARRRERWLKSGQGREWLKEQIRPGGGIGRRNGLKIR